MKWSEYKNERRIKEFTKRCLEENIDIVKSCWAKAKDVEDFATKIFEKKESITAQAYWLLSRDFHGHMVRVKKWLSDKEYEEFTTYSNMGCVAIGNDDFKFNITNYYGDGDTRVFIFKERTEEISNVFDFISTFQGKDIKIYKIDTNPVDAEYILPEGRYGVYAYNGVVAIEKMGEPLGDTELSSGDKNGNYKN